MRKALFFDRDGIVNLPTSYYISSIEEFLFRLDFFQLFEWAKANNFVTIIVTNQKGVAKGHVTQKNLQLIHSMMQRELKLRTGYQFDDIYACTAPEEADSCYKPNPQMLNDAMEKWKLHPNLCWILGDQPRDIEAGLRAGINTCFVHPELRVENAHLNCKHLIEALQSIAEWHQRLLHSHKSSAL